MLIIFHVQNVYIIFDRCLCDFLVLKHIDEVDALHLHLSFTDVDILSCLKCSTISILLLIIYWCWLFFMFKMFLSLSTDVYVIFLYWQDIDEVDALHLHLSFTDVDIFLVWKIFQNFNIAFDYLLMLTTFYAQNVLIIVNWCLCDFLVLKHINKFYTVHLHLVIYWCWHIIVWKIFQNFNISFDYLLMLIIFHVQNVYIIFDRCLCDFLVLKHIDEVDALHLHLSFTDVDIFLCLKCSTISILLLIIYWCWLFFMCKMFLSLSTDVYVIFLYWNISINSTHFIFLCHLVMLTYFCVGNIPEF